MKLFIFEEKPSDGFDPERVASYGIIGFYAKDKDEAWLLLAENRGMSKKEARDFYQLLCRCGTVKPGFAFRM